MATYAIGDIQGCWPELEKLLEKISFDPAKDRLWIVGDLVNRGPKNVEVLRWAMNNEKSLVVVLGNHDLHLISRHLGLVPKRRRDTLEDVLSAPDRDELLAWLRRRPLLHRDGHYLMVHAGLYPAWTADDAERIAREVETAIRGDSLGALLLAALEEEPRPWDDALTGIERWRVALFAFTQLRTIRKNGTPDARFKGPPEDAPKGSAPWFLEKDRRSRDVTVVFGHWASLGLFESEHAIALDTGAVWGNELTAIRLEDHAIFRVKSSREA
jgi:bis(5'-nucleosyl)-tetraphosphatase (symmetrical)